MTEPSPPWTRAFCAARGRGQARAVSPALATFRANRDELHRNDPRLLVGDAISTPPPR